MAVYQKGRELKNASVVYDASGNPSLVTVDGVNYDPSGYEFKETKTNVKTKDVPASKEAKVNVDANTEEKASDSVLTTKDIKRK